MSIELITTPGGTTSNSYASLTEAQSYIDTILYAEAWAEATENDQKKALISSTRMLENLCEWKGSPVSSSQALKWPRRGVLTRVSATGGGTSFHSHYHAYGGILTPLGVELPEDEIPQFLKDATTELARSLLISDRISEQDSGNVSSIAIPGLTIGYLGSGSNSKRKLIPPQVYQMIAFYADTVFGHTVRRVIRS